MSDSLSDHPDLDQLRRRAKELRAAARSGEASAVERFARRHPDALPGTISLAAAQLVIARELGFPSWPRLKAAVDAHTAAQAQERSFVAAAIDGPVRRAAEILRADPEITGRSLRAAAVVGDADTVRRMLATEPAAAVAVDGERGWPALLYACYSRWPEVEPDRAAAIADVVRLLLDAGANPNTNDGGRPRFRSALKGAVEADNAGSVEVLLDAGAHPDLGQPIVEAVGRGDDRRCLRLLLSHGARVAGTWALGAAVFHDDALASSLLLGSLEAAGQDAAGAATEALPEAAAAASLPLVRTLLDAGADPRARDEGGFSALRSAVRAGRNDTAEHLKALGALDDGTEVDRFLGSCRKADGESARRLLADHPDVLDRLTDDDRAVIVHAAADRRPAALALMLELGLPHDARDDSGQQALHNAAYHGNAASIRLLLDAGAEVDARDTRFDATPLAFATVGSREQEGEPGDWPETVRLLLDAGAVRDGVVVAEKPPSEEVAALLRSRGVATAAAAGPADDLEPPGPIGGGVMAEIAEHLRTACRDRDLGVLASLLHPDVRWTGLCRNREQVLEWFRHALADGTTPTVESVEVDRDAVVLGLTLTRPGEGARPAPPQRLYQVYTVAGTEIVDIRGYPDRRSALKRA